MKTRKGPIRGRKKERRRIKRERGGRKGERERKEERGKGKKEGRS